METIEKPKFQLLGIKLVNDRFWFVMKMRKTLFSEHNCACPDISITANFPSKFRILGYLSESSKERDVTQ